MSSYKLSIEPLGYNNYPMWQQRMKDVLRKEGLLTAVEPKPEGSRAAALTEAEQDKALGLLRLHLDDSKLSEVQELDTALKVWTCLASTHQKGARAQRYQFRSEWAGLKQVSDERIAAYVQRLRTASANMRSSGQAVDATEEVMTLLHGLTDPYRTIVSVWQVSPTPPENMEAVLPSLLAREQELIENSGDEALALYSSRQQNSKRGSRFSSRQLSSHSHSHSQPGLSAQAAYAGRAGGQTVVGTGRQRQRSGQQQPWRTAQPSQWSDKRCYSCGEVGHIAAQCPRGGSNVGGDRSGNGPRAYTARGGQEVGETVCGMNVFSKEDITVVNKAGLQANASHEHAWVMDSGASLHCTPCRSMLHEFREYSPGERALVQADGKEGKGLDILGEGLVYLRAKGVGRAANSAPLVRLRRVLWVPRLATNLFSVAKAVDSGAEIAELSSDRFSLTWKKEAMVVGHRQQSAQGGLYIISCKYTHSNTAQKGGMHSQEVAQAKPAVVQRSKADRLHRRMGHLGYQNLEKLLSMAEGADVTEKQVKEASKGVCEECQEGKQVAQPFPDSSRAVKAPLELVHTDVCGPLTTQARGGFRYFLTLTDHFTKYSAVIPLHSKEEAPRKLCQTILCWERMHSSKVKVIRSDNGKEYVNNFVGEFCAKHGTVHELTCPYTPQQNGVAERLNRTLLGTVRTMLREAQVSKEWWVYAVITANYLRNRSPATGQNSTPYQLWTGEKPSLAHLRVWGCTAWVLIPRGQRKDKLDPVSKKGKLVGYADAHLSTPSKGWLVHLEEDDRVVCSRSVVFDENVYWNELPAGEQMLDEEEHPAQQHSPAQPAISSSCNSSNESEHSEQYDSASEADEPISPAQPQPLRRSSRLQSLAANMPYSDPHTLRKQRWGESVGKPVAAANAVKRRPCLRAS